MDDMSTDAESLLARIQRLENENKELRKDVEQLCTKQAGPRYLHIANRMHYQKAAGLEQEVKKLREELNKRRGEISNLKEELSEASDIKMKLEDLHKAEGLKKKEAENQLKFFQEGIAADIADRDKAHVRLEEMKSDAMRAQEHVTMLQIDMAEMDRESVLFKKVVDKFHQIRQQYLYDWEDEGSSYIDKCSYLLRDPDETWSFNTRREAETAQNINALQEECRSLKDLVDDLQSKVQMGSDIENDLKRKVCNLQNKMKISDELIDDRISSLRRCYSEQRNDIADLLDEGNSHLMSLFHELVQNFRLENLLGEGLPSLQQNVSALMSLQELEDRLLQERNGKAVLMNELIELQRSFEQVTAEKLEALMKLEIVERELLSGKTVDDGRLAKLPANNRDRAITSTEREGRFANLLKRASFKRLIGVPDFDDSDSSFHSVNNMVLSRMKIEIDTLNESLRNLEHLTSGIHKLRVSLVKAMEAFMSNDNTSDSLMRSIEHIISEANIVQTSLCSSIPISRADDDGGASSSHGFVDESDEGKDLRQLKIKSVSAAGFEMVELLLLVAQTVKDKASERRNRGKRILRIQ